MMKQRILLLLKSKWLMLLLAGMIMLTVLCKTHTGNRILLLAANYWVSGLKVELLSGRLFSGGLIQLEYTAQGATVTAKNLHLNLNWFDCATLCLSVSSGEINVHLANSSEVKNTSSLAPTSTTEASDEYIKLPFSIGIESLTVKSMTLNTGQQQVSAENLGLAAKASDAHIQVGYLSAQKLIVDNRAVAEKSAFVVPDKIAPLQLPSVFIPLDVDIQRLHLEEMVYRTPSDAPTILGDIRADISVEQQVAEVNQFQFTYKDAIARMDLRYDVSTSVIKGALSYGNVYSTAVLLVDGDMDNLILRGRVSGKASGLISLQVSPTVVNWPFNLDARLSSLDIDRVGRVNHLNLSGSGDLDNYQANIDAVFDSSGHYDVGEDILLDMSLTGRLSKINFEKSRITVGDAYSELSAQASWQSGLKTQLQGRLHALPLPHLGIEEAATLSGEYEVRFLSVHDQWSVTIPKLDLKGKVADLPLEIALSGEMADDYIGKLEQAQIKYGRSTVIAAGVIGDSADLRFDANINHSANKVLPLDAVMDAQLHVKGSVTKPQLMLNAQLSKIDLEDKISIAQGTLSAQLDTQKDYQGRIELDISDINAAQLDHGQLQFVLDGNRQSHAAHLSLRSAQFALMTSLHGLLDKNIWRGQISKGAFTIDDLKGKLAAPVDLQVGQDSFSLANTCWLINGGRACASAMLAEQQGEMSVNLEHIPLNSVKRWIDNGVSVQGKLNGAGKVSIKHGNVAALDTKLWVKDAQVAIDLPAEVEVTEGLPINVLNVQEFEVSLATSEKDIEAQWHVEFEKLGLIKGGLSFADMQLSQQATGYIHINEIKLHQFTPYARAYSWPDISLDGALNGTINFSGDLSNPSLFGQLHAENLSVESSYLPMQVTELTLSTEFDERQLSLQGGFKTPQDGLAQVSGHVDWQSELTLDASVKGTNLHVTPMPGVKVAVSPDLTVGYAEKLIDIRGVVSVPFARFTLDTLPEEAIVVSDDQIIIDDTESEKGRALIDYRADIDIKLLDDVRVVALGLDAYLTGALDIERQVGNAPLAGGEVSLLEGKYTAFGQDLLIETGQLGFNGPLDKPYLNIRAIRNPETTADDVIAGVSVTGSIASPQLTIFAEPAMDQAKALEYLLNGARLGAGESSNNTLLAQFLLAKSIDKSKRLFTKAGKKLGLRDINLAAKGSGDDTQVELSGYITPSVQVSYRVGVFASLSEIAVRYRIFSKLYLEATSGLYDSIDLLYKFDWGD
ncbi:translocation/assembly module TamB domain-containing protein [Pseudoalteromonas luteoviolacea]|uniref:translocation/assembly module TamB domain-containing protein n=1 Tax=Pseudoalteromonas luteoviolacea TaxID=43657 RepID=UPI001B39C57E|nr:translocation/assembly module TamB domain-containing protein [Pseudoalteromonas luteoviolacea]MBQ4836444.1 translocation/assembly module TamB domain-containing protein [Pseudoalteromonas luteoviolacea]